MFSDPQNSNVQSTDPQSTDPQSTDPQSSDLQSTDPQSTDPQSSNFQSTDPQSSDFHSSSPQDSDGKPVYSLQSLGFALLWLAFVAYAFLLAPPDRPETADLIVQLSSGQWADLNPLLVALFNLMGIWPLIYSTVLYADGHGQKLPAWPFAIGTFGIGAFSLLPYLALREPHGTLGSGTVGDSVGSQPTRMLRFWDSRILAIGLAIATVGLLGYGAIAGDWADFVHQWQTSRFVHVMSLDFVLLSVLFPALMGDDAARRGWTGDRQPAWLGWLGAVPLLGAVIYGCVRPPLAAATPINSPSSPATKDQCRADS